MVDSNTRLLDTIDLTGDEPVITTKIVKEIFINSSDEDDDDDENIEPLVRKVRVTSKKCEVCLEEVSKYTCPCCVMRTCSLDCVLTHKQRTGCSGERDKTSFVPRTELNNIHLLNDYRLLEEVARVTDNAQRDDKARKNWPGIRVNKLCHHAQKAGVRWYSMEKGMKRHNENRSRYNFGEQCLEWMVKLVFVDISKEVCELAQDAKVLREIIEKYIHVDKVAAEDKITFASYLHRDETDEVKVFFRNEFDSEGDNLRYTEVDDSKTLRDCLCNSSVLEYPVFHVVLNKDTVKKMTSELLVKGKEVMVIDRKIVGENVQEKEVVAKKAIVSRLAPLDDWLDQAR